MLAGLGNPGFGFPHLQNGVLIIMTVMIIIISTQCPIAVCTEDQICLPGLSGTKMWLNVTDRCCIGKAPLLQSH